MMSPAVSDRAAAGRSAKRLFVAYDHSGRELGVVRAYTQRSAVHEADKLFSGVDRVVEDEAA